MPFCSSSLSQTDQPCTPAFSCEALARRLPEQTPFRAGDVITMADGAASTPRLPVPVDLCVSIRPTCPSLATWSTSARVRRIVTRSSPPPPPPDLGHESPPPPPVAEKNLSTFGSSWNNSYRSVLHSHPRSHGYAGVSTSLVKNPAATPTPPLVAEGGRQRWGSPHSFNDEDDRTTSTTSGSYVINPDELRKEIDDLILSDMIV